MRVIIDIIQNPSDGGVTIFTDGSKMGRYHSLPEALEELTDELTYRCNKTVETEGTNT